MPEKNFLHTIKGKSPRIALDTWAETVGGNLSRAPFFCHCFGMEISFQRDHAPYLCVRFAFSSIVHHKKYPLARADIFVCLFDVEYRFYL